MIHAHTSVVEPRDHPLEMLFAQTIFEFERNFNQLWGGTYKCLRIKYC